jgi:acetaldehyde dehydrogenase (acetylating)
VHTRSREAAVRFGSEVPASRITVNTPTTHGAIGFSTALPPSMTLGCGSWGGNVTSDNISPLHLMDIKRVAFETRPVKSTRPAVSTSATAPARPPMPQRATTRAMTAQPAGSGPGKINREEIAAIVDRFLAGREPQPAQRPTPAPARPAVEAEAGSMYSAPPQGSPPAERAGAGNGGSGTSERRVANAAPASANRHKTVDFVSEDDVRRAIQKGEKIYITAKTIITPAARDIGEPAEIFAKT